ncbi:ATP-binding protein [Patulibacter brassicae]|uniref:histidine kinase n=1 Tax=Patulibacter brassicae TaxID=1705717 RepID=A0ABU4VK34_9ACTN|nr:ATP-binding protein [Patulibacter brassicae]MDX8152168.1 ATP-binding protein [Patulibacter brassicae]
MSGADRAPRGRGRAPSIRQSLGLLLVAVVVLAAVLAVVTVLQQRTANERTAAEQQRMTSFQLADQMRQTSNDLTRMVRLYVATGEERYRRYYNDILEIRAGRAPRPRRYDSSFWDRVLAHGLTGVRFGPPASLTALMARAHFARAEFDALNRSLGFSNALARTELDVMRRVAPRIARGVDAAYRQDTATQYERLLDDAYHRQKASIMGAIERFIGLVDQRTATRADALQARTDRLLLAQSTVLALFVLLVGVALAVSARTIVRPLQRLTAATRAITRGEWSQRASPDGVRELRQLAGDFNEMADAVQRDLARRIAAERDATDAQRRLRTIADRVPGSVFQFHVDEHGALSVRFASRDASIHGAGAEESAEFVAVSQAVLPADRGAWLDSMVAAVRRGGAWQHEYRIRRSDGTVAWMRAQAVARPHADGSGDLYGYVGDVTDQKALQADLLRAREAAESADRAKSAFLAMVSHELRTPLVAVTGTLEVLGLDDLEPRQRELVDVALRSASTLLAVIGDVLDFSKIESGHLDLAARPVAVGRLVAELAEQYRHAAAAKGVTLRAVGVDEPRLAPAHLVDPDRLRQVLGNLVSNAIKYTPGGEVDLSIALVAAGPSAAGDARRQALRFTVRDTGVGVAPEDQERLFAPFAQARARTDGTGLGLVIARQLTEAMGGTLTMESAVGVGTTMRVALALPVSDEPERRQLTAVGPGRPAGLTARRRRPDRERARDDRSLVLLVEDHPVNREVLRRQLETIGFVTDVAGDGAEALERLRGERYALVFSDVQLPDIDGYELVRRWRAEERAIPGRQRVPVVALTASAVLGEEDRCRAAGMDDLVTKPAPMAVLAGTLRRWLPHLAWEEPAPAPPGGGAPVGPEPPQLDREILDEVTGGDPVLARRLLETYCASLDEDLARAEAAYAEGQREQLRRVAHQVVGASRTVGASSVAEAAGALQRVVAGGDEDPGPALAALRAATDAVRGATVA